MYQPEFTMKKVVPDEPISYQEARDISLNKVGYIQYSNCGRVAYTLTNLS